MVPGWGGALDPAGGETGVRGWNVIVEEADLGSFKRDTYTEGDEIRELRIYSDLIKEYSKNMQFDLLKENLDKLSRLLQRWPE